MSDVVSYQWISSAVSAVSALSPVLSAVAGGFIGAWATGRVRDRQDKRVLDREHHGLLRLVASEIRSNGILLRSFVEETDLIHPKYVPAVRTDAWEDVRVKLVQYVEEDHFDFLDVYYYKIHALQTAVIAHPELSKSLPKGKAPKDKPKGIWAGLAKDADKAGSVAWYRCVKALEDSPSNDEPPKESSEKEPA